MANDVVLYQIDQLTVMAEAVAKSGLFGIKTAPQALALMLIAQAENRHPATAARDFHVIQGTPSKKTEAMLRDFLESGGKVEWHQLDDSMARATFSHPAGGKVTIDWDMKRAKQAGLGGRDMWSKYPRQMLRNRCVSEGIRTVCPSATSGMYEPGEVQDFATTNDMGPIEVSEKPMRAVQAAMSSQPLSAEVEKHLRELAAMLVQIVEVDGNPSGAYQILIDENLDDEQKLYLWNALGPNTKTRAALKKEAAIKAKDSRGEIGNAIADLHSEQPVA